MLYVILALTFGAMGLSFYEYFTPYTPTNMLVHLSIDLLWLPLLGFWLVTFWNATFQPKQTISGLKFFLITPVLATLTLGITQLNWGLHAGLLFSQNQMLAKAHSLKGAHGSGTIGLFQFAEFWRTNDRSVFVLSNAPYGDNTGLIYTEEFLDDSEPIVTGQLLVKPHIIQLFGNWSYWRHEHDSY